MCGWSADWNSALRSAFERCPSRRFATYWTVRKPKPPGELVRRLIDHRGAVTILIDGADWFFSQLAEHVTSLEELSRPHPLSADLARETLKRYVAEERHHVRPFDLTMAEVNRVRQTILDENPVLYGVAPNRDELLARMGRYEALTEVVRPLMATGCFWGGGGHRWVWREALERLTNLPELNGGYKVWANLRRYPTLLALCAGGMAAVAREDYGILHTLLVEAQVGRPYLTGSESAVRRVNTSLVLDEEGVGFFYRRLNFHLADDAGLRETLRELLPRDEQFRQVFDRFEYLFGSCTSTSRSRPRTTAGNRSGCSPATTSGTIPWWLSRSRTRSPASA